ncbi:MAG: hypothetical protein WCW63_04150 [Acholeplasmataceae bacterium]|jgi:hypothetical protein
MIIIERTTAVADKTVKDLRRLSFLIAIIVQVIFLCLYGFKIYINLNRIFYLTIYCFLASVSLFGFIFFLSTNRIKKLKKVSGTKRGLRVSKYLANTIMIVVILIEFFQLGASDLELILSAFSITSFIFQIMFELVRSAYDKYSELFMTALNMDFAKFDIISDPKSYLLSAVNTPLEKISNKITGAKTEKKEPTKIEQCIDQLTREHKKQQKEAKKTRANEEKREIKEHFNILLSIFKKKKRNGKSPPHKKDSPKQLSIK